jgi:hypothetical protein
MQLQPPNLLVKAVRQILAAVLVVAVMPMAAQAVLVLL